MRLGGNQRLSSVPKFINNLTLVRHAFVPSAATEEDVRIGKYIAQDLVEDGATLQMGIGAIPDAVSDNGRTVA